MIPYSVLGGYLGAGKTTLLNHILSGDHGRRIALLINDFGDINIDAGLIESQSDQQMNLTNGCICCTLTDGFFDALEDLQALDPPPEQIIVEASGVADVNRLANYGQSGSLELDAVIVIADAETIRAKASDKYVASTVRRQLAAADLIVVNKVDLVSNEALAATLEWLNEETGGIPLVTAERCRVPLDLLTQIEHRGALDGGDAHAHYARWSFSQDEAVDASKLHDFLNSLGPEVLRAKGWFRLTDGTGLEVQRVGRRLETRPKEPAPDRCQLVAIGLEHELEPQTLQNSCEAHLKENRID